MSYTACFFLSGGEGGICRDSLVTKKQRVCPSVVSNYGKMKKRIFDVLSHSMS